MSKFTLTIRKEYDFDGDKVVAKMSRLTRTDALLIMPHVQKAADAAQSGDKVAMAMEDSMAYMEAAGTVLRNSIKDLSGLFIDDEEVKPGGELFSTMLDSIYFMNLMMMMVNDLVSESFLKVEDEKKPDEQSEETTSG